MRLYPAVSSIVTSAQCPTTMNFYSDSELLEVALKALASKDEQTKIKAANDTKTHLEAAARELSLERFGQFEEELYHV